jgi:hypothetical protein
VLRIMCLECGSGLRRVRMVVRRFEVAVF